MKLAMPAGDRPHDIEKKERRRYDRKERTHISGGGMDGDGDGIRKAGKNKRKGRITK